MQGGSVTTSIFNSLFLVTLSDCMDSTAPLALEVFYDSITVSRMRPLSENVTQYVA